MEEATPSATHKEIKRTTAACEACQERKRKCDGNPCSYCIAKHIECKFIQQKKRGPAKKRGVDTITTVSTVAPSKRQLTTNVPHYLETEMLDKAVARRYLNLYFRFEHHFCGNPIETLLAARTVAHKVQLYAALADAAQSCGEFMKSKMFISQARVLSGSIFDSADADTVKGLMMMRKFFYHTLDFGLSSHYSSVAWSLARLLKDSIEDKTKLTCQLSANMADSSTSVENKLSFLRDTISQGRLRFQAPHGNFVKDMSSWFLHYLTLAADFIEHFDFNIFYPHDGSVSTIFRDFRNINLSQETRLKMLSHINEIMLAATDIKMEILILVMTYKIYCPMYQTLINWRSGNITEAMSSALTCLQALNALNALNDNRSTDFLAACRLVSGYTHMCSLGGVYQFFMEQRQTQLADSIERHIQIICKTRGPVYDPILEFMAEYKLKQGNIFPDSPTMISASSPELSPSSSPLSFSPSPSSDEAPTTPASIAQSASPLYIPQPLPENFTIPQSPVNIITNYQIASPQTATNNLPIPDVLTIQPYLYHQPTQQLDSPYSHSNIQPQANAYINMYSPSALHQDYASNLTTESNVFDVDSLTLVDQLLAAPDNFQFHDPTLFLDNQVAHN